MFSNKKISNLLFIFIVLFICILLFKEWGESQILKQEKYARELKLAKQRLVEEDNLKIKNSTSTIQQVPKLAEDFPSKSEIEDFGIREVLGTGYSNFSGSDYARNYNIRAALQKIDGLKIAPGETFSTLEYLSPFTKENGYIKGLIIKGNEILPDIGGGMCQISTTLFRAAMNSGLKIVERTNHSLWLHWYDDPRTHTPGTDATIYDTDGGKDTDFKFKNNTDNYIEIKVRVDKAGHLNIDFWGTKDGREGVIYEPQIIKELFVSSTTASTTNLTSRFLPKGKTFCNGPFKGATAYFTYGVSDKDGKETVQNFYSYYKPQERICNTGI